MSRHSLLGDPGIDGVAAHAEIVRDLFHGEPAIGDVRQFALQKESDSSTLIQTESIIADLSRPDQVSSVLVGREVTWRVDSRRFRSEELIESRYLMGTARLPQMGSAGPSELLPSNGRRPRRRRPCPLAKTALEQLDALERSDAETMASRCAHSARGLRC